MGVPFGGTLVQQSDIRGAQGREERGTGTGGTPADAMNLDAPHRPPSMPVLVVAAREVFVLRVGLGPNVRQQVEDFVLRQFVE